MSDCSTNAFRFHTARIVYLYGGGGKPKPDEYRMATCSFVCEQCRKHVSPNDRFCKHCGARFTGSVDDCDVDK